MHYLALAKLFCLVQTFYQTSTYSHTKKHKYSLFFSTFCGMATGQCRIVSITGPYIELLCLKSVNFYNQNF